MSVSLVSNAYLDENSTKIRSKPVPWEVCTSFFPSSPLSCSAGIPARGTRHLRGACTHQKGRQTAQAKDGVHPRLRRPGIRGPISPPAQEASESRYHAVSPRLDRRRTLGCVARAWCLDHSALTTQMDRSR